MSPELLAVAGLNLTVLAGQAALWYKIGKLEGKVHLHLNHHQEEYDGRPPRRNAGDPD